MEGVEEEAEKLSKERKARLAVVRSDIAALANLSASDDRERMVAKLRGEEAELVQQVRAALPPDVRDRQLEGLIERRTKAMAAQTALRQQALAEVARQMALADEAGAKAEAHLAEIARFKAEREAIAVRLAAAASLPEGDDGDLLGEDAGKADVTAALRVLLARAGGLAAERGEDFAKAMQMASAVFEGMLAGDGRQSAAAPGGEGEARRAEGGADGGGRAGGGEEPEPKKSRLQGGGAGASDKADGDI